MRRKRFLGFLPVFCLLALPLAVYGQQYRLKLGKVKAEYNEIVDIPLSVDSPDRDLQGVVAVFDWDASSGVKGVGLTPASPLLDPTLEEGADTVVVRADPGANYMILGVVMDAVPTDNGGVEEVIPAGDDTLLATVTLQAAPAPDPVADIVTPLTFKDLTYATVDGGPVLENIVVDGGFSIAEGQGLELVDGEIISAPAPDALRIEDTTANAPGDAQVKIRMDNHSEDAVEGAVVAMCWSDPNILFVDAVLGADSSQADFTAYEVAEDGATFGFVIDLIDPMEFPPNIEPGVNLHIATFVLACDGPDCPKKLGDPCHSADLQLCDNAVGSPVKENLIVRQGLSYTAPDLELEGGTVTFCPPTVVINRETDCGLGRDVCCSNGIDDDGDTLVDMDDPDCQTFDFEVLLPDEGGDLVPPDCDLGPALEVPIGGVVEAPLYMNSPDVDGDGVPDAVQGFSLVLSYPCDKLEALPGGDFIDITGSILEANGAEFIGSNHTNPATPETGPCGENFCSVVLGILVDATPPFDGQVIPGLPGPQFLGNIKFQVLDGAECGEVIVVEQADCGAKGGGNTPAFNLVSVDNFPYPASVRPIEICIAAEEYFYRGDCNFSLRNGTFHLVDPVEVADAAAVISYLYLPEPFHFEPPCLDACDANDDGRINLTDAINILYFLFIPGVPALPAPGPGFDPAVWPVLVRTGRGPDTPKVDQLDCKAGRSCDIIDPEDPGCPEVPCP